MHLGKLFCSAVKQLKIPYSAPSNQTVALNVLREVWREFNSVPGGSSLRDTSRSEAHC